MKRELSAGRRCWVRRHALQTGSSRNHHSSYELNGFPFVVGREIPPTVTASGLADGTPALRCNRDLFRLGFDRVSAIRCTLLLFHTCKPLERISCSILNAITGLVKFADNFEYLVA